MINKYILLSIFLFSTILRADILFSENFDTENVWPNGWTHDIYLNPESGDTVTSGPYHNWRGGSTRGPQPVDEGYTPPAAVFWWSPSVPVPTRDPTTWYELALNSPDIDVGDNNHVLVKFDIGLVFFQADIYTNGMLIEVNGGSGWVEMLKYEIGPGNFVDLSFRTESFVTEVEGGTLQLRWKAYGTDSYYIDAWIIDNIRVISLPKLSSVQIESNNTTDNQTAIEGNEVTLSLISETALVGPPYVQINGNEAVVNPQGSNTYTSSYTVSNTDADGPLTYSIDFTSLDGGIDGATVNNTTDNSRVIIDRTAPPPFSVGDAVSMVGGNVFEGKWNSTNTSLGLEVDVPEDSAVIDFNYFQGNSISFDGSDDRATIPGNSLYQFSDQFTVEMWIKPNSYQDYEGAFSYGIDGAAEGGFAIAYFATGWCFYIKTTNSITSWETMINASAPTAQWTHLAGTYDGSKARLYRNGILMGEEEMTGNIEWENVENLYIGYFNSNSLNKYFDGQIDEVRLWSTTRTALQIKGNKSITLQGNESGLVGYWKADESSGNILNDVTSNQISGILNGATFATLNSPINFSTPVYDNTVIIGSNYHLRTKMGSNDFQAFDDLQEITNADFVATTKTISGTASSFTGVNGYQHNETALISALLYDQSGNFSLGDTSAMTLEIDLIANDPISVSITSSNDNSSYAKTGDMVTITMSYDEDIGSTSTSIENNNATDTDLGSEQFKAEYTLTGSEPEGILDFAIDALDYMGNPGSFNLTTDGSQVTYDKTPPTLPSVNIASNNADTSWAKVGDTIIVTFTSDEILSDTASTIIGHNTSVSSVVENQFKTTYAPINSDTEGAVTFHIQFSDRAANEGTAVTASTNNTKVIFDRTPPADFTVGLLTPTGGNQVAGIWNLTNTGMDIIVPVANDTTLKNGTVQLYGKVGSNDFEVLGSISTILSSEINTDKTITVTGELIEGITGFAEGETIYIKATMNDRPGNSKEGSQSATEILIDETPASITPIAIISNNDNTALAKVGDTVTVSFTTSEILTDTTTTISGQSATITGLGSNQFKAVYVMAEGDPEGVIEFEISFIDVQGNPLTGTNATTDASQVTFDKTKPTLDPVTITSDNSCSTGAIAKAENIVTINFTSLETLLSTFVIVMGDTLAVTDLGSSLYKIDYQLTVEDVEGNVPFLIRVTDLAGNISEDITTTTDGSTVEFDPTLPLLTNVHIESNNNYSSIAVLGDITTLTFEADEPLSSTTVVISSSTVTATESNGVYTANYTIQESDLAVGGFLSFAIDFVDCPGNIGLTDSTTTDESFVSIDIGPPEMVSVKIFSSNQDSSWSKVDDSVFVYFVVNEPLKLEGNPISSLAISGNTVDLYNVESTSYQGHYVMTNSDTEGNVALQISFYDLGSQAGNDGTPIQATTDNSRVIFDKTNPGITAASFLTNNIYSDSLAKVGDVGTITFLTNEVIRNISAQLDNDEITLTGSGQDYSYAHTFSDTNDNGNMIINIMASDSAGNESDTLLNRVYFDKIPPSVFNFYEGSIVSDQVYTKYADSLQFAWSIAESESGSKNAYIALGSDSGLVDILNWSLASNVNQGPATSLSLSNNSKYYGAVYVEDNVGNKSDSIWGNGIIVDLSAPIPGIVWDGFLSEDIDYTADSNLLFVQWSDFTDNQSIDYYEASIGSLDDTTNISDWQRADQLDNIQITGLNLSRGIQYFAYLRAADSAANISSGIRSDGVEFDNTPPGIKSIYPFFDSLEVLSVTNNDQIQISFNKPILKFGLKVMGTQDSTVNYEITKQDSGVIISILDTLPSYETITVVLDTAIAFNLLNYTDTIIFRSKLWGDLNNDYQISVEDVLAFNQAWPYSSTDLGPVSGDPPFLFPSPDGELNLEDLSAFGKMWIWYYHEYNSDSLSSLYLSDEKGLSGTISKNNISLSIPKMTYAAEIVFFNSNQSLENLMINNLHSSAFKYAFSDSIQSSISFIVADKNGLDSTLSFSVLQGFPEDFISNVKYKFIDSEANEISKGTGQLVLKILPDRFDVYQNYPNPFNAETIIRYDLPKSEDVSIKIYNIIGREIYSTLNKKQKPGNNSFIWKGNSNVGGVVSSGMYFLQISAGKELKRMKMLLLK